MNADKRTVEATIQLTKSNCYYMNHGVCSLSLIHDFFISIGDRLAQSDLLYCPRLYKQMTEKDMPVTAVPCECGHLQIMNGHQRACIAERKALDLSVKINATEVARPLCDVCGGQISLDDQEDVGKRILSLSVRPDSST